MKQINLFDLTIEEVGVSTVFQLSQHVKIKSPLLEEGTEEDYYYLMSFANKIGEIICIHESMARNSYTVQFNDGLTGIFYAEDLLK
jgi:hypothetical protein